MMEKDQLPHMCSKCHFAGHRRGGVPVSLCGRKPGELSAVVSFQVLRIMDQHIRIFGKIHQPAVRAYVALRIRGVHNRLTVPCDPVNVDSARMSIRFMDVDDKCIVT